MTRSNEVDVWRYVVPERRTRDNWQVVKLGCAPTSVERIVPPAGGEYAFDIQHYRRNVEVYVSPTGRSVRVYVDGVEVPR